MTFVQRFRAQLCRGWFGRWCCGRQSGGGGVDAGRPPHALTARPSRLLQRCASTHPLRREALRRENANRNIYPPRDQQHALCPPPQNPQLFRTRERRVVHGSFGGDLLTRAEAAVPERLALFLSGLFDWILALSSERRPLSGLLLGRSDTAG